MGDDESKEDEESFSRESAEEEKEEKQDEEEIEPGAGKVGSPTKPPKDEAAGKKQRSLLQFLKDEKEIITTILFFVGGAIWLYTAFATKHYVASVKCLLGATI